MRKNISLRTFTSCAQSLSFSLLICCQSGEEDILYSSRTTVTTVPMCSILNVPSTRGFILGVVRIRLPSFVSKQSQTDDGGQTQQTGLQLWNFTALCELPFSSQRSIITSLQETMLIILHPVDECFQVDAASWDSTVITESLWIWSLAPGLFLLWEREKNICCSNEMSD